MNPNLPTPLAAPENASSQNSKNTNNGTLYLVATPIGNLKDISLRALETLKEVDSIVCEDTRRTSQLLNHYAIHKPLITLFAAKEKKTAPKIVELLLQQKSIALVSDAGMPGVSDPGSLLVQLAQEQKIPIIPIPGASALPSALSASGMGQKGCIFLGFLPRNKGKIRKELALAAEQKRAIVFYESPFRVIATLKLAQEVLGNDWGCFVAREMTKMYEEYLSGSIFSILQQLENRKILGEFTIVLQQQKHEHINKYD